MKAYVVEIRVKGETAARYLAPSGAMRQAPFVFASYGAARSVAACYSRVPWVKVEIVELPNPMSDAETEVLP